MAEVSGAALGLASRTLVSKFQPRLLSTPVPLHLYRDVPHPLPPEWVGFATKIPYHLYYRLCALSVFLSNLTGHDPGLAVFVKFYRRQPNPTAG